MWRDYTNLGKWGIVRLILLVIFIILVILGAKYSKAECITIYDNTKEIVAENAYNPAKDEVEFFRHGKILMDSEIFAEPNSSCIEFFGNVHKHATEIFIREINGFFELSSGGFVKKEAVTFDFDEESQIFPNKYNLSDMRVNNMINLPIQYLGSLSQKTAGDGVTNKSKLFFVGDIPIYEFIDGYAYFPSGRNIYKISLEHFSDIKNVGESYEVLAAYRTVYYTGSSYNRRYNT